MASPRVHFLAALDGLDTSAIRQLLVRALDYVPDSDLVDLADGLIPERVLLPTDADDLLYDARRFDRDSRAGRYYQSFNVNSKNFKDYSEGTERWIEAFHVLTRRALAAIDEGRVEEGGQALDLLLKLLVAIDEMRVDIIFLADEHGSWQVGADLDRMLPAWFRWVASTTDAHAYGDTVVTVLRKVGGYGDAWRRYLPAAMEAADAEQRDDLEVVAG